MRVKDFKYLMAYIVPISLFLGLIFLGNWTYLTVIIAFVAIPIFELVIPPNHKNLETEVALNKDGIQFFDWLLYLNLPIVFASIWFFLETVSTTSLSNFELTGITLSMGIVLGANGINVAHELGHRDSKFQQFLSCLLLLPCLYQHFFVEHNFGHHKRVGTDEDPASAKYNEWIYTFWFRSIIHSYIDAWSIELDFLKAKSKSIISIENRMLLFLVSTVLYLSLVLFFFKVQALLLMMAAALIGILLLESINYVEHYGLRRKKLDNGRYETVQHYHSWNSDHELGRIFLYELTRHSDHHFRANKKYQLLDSHLGAPQLPLGYPGSIVLALISPLWFRIMNPKVLQWQNKRA